VFYVAHACFDEDSLERSRASHTYMIRNSPQYVKDRIGFTDEIEQQVAAATERGGYREAARFVSDDMLREFVYMGDKAAVASQGASATEMAARPPGSATTVSAPRMTALSEQRVETSATLSPANAKA